MGGRLLLCAIKARQRVRILNELLEHLQSGGAPAIVWLIRTAGILGVYGHVVYGSNIDRGFVRSGKLRL